MLKCLHRILEMRGSAGLYVTTNGTTSLETLGLVCNALVRHCCKTSWIVMLRVLLPTNQTVLQQTRLLQVANLVPRAFPLKNGWGVRGAGNGPPIF